MIDVATFRVAGALISNDRKCLELAELYRLLISSQHMADRKNALLLERIAQTLGVSIDSIVAADDQEKVDCDIPVGEMAELIVLFEKIKIGDDRLRVLDLARQLSSVR